MTTKVPPELIDDLKDTDVTNTSSVVGTTVKDALDTLDGISSGALVLLATATASASSSIDFISGINDTFDHYVFEGIGIVPAIDNAELFVLTSANGGSSYDNSASDYVTSYLAGTNGNPSQNGGGDTAQIDLTFSGQNTGNAAGASINFSMTLYAPANASLWTIIDFKSSFITADGDGGFTSGMGARESAAIVDALRFILSVGDMVSGEFKHYGVKK